MANSSNSQANDETELTMCDVLEEEQELEEDANAVLGGSDDTNCSYDRGYVPRQALYACITCSSGQEPSGVCLACSYKCHDGHEIVELYTKRNFRCDCGNSKFAGKTCSLKPDKELLNSLNKYNQNFRGLYCSCSRPYPDLEDNTPDEMIQCVMCEDWYHGRHIGGIIPDDYFEMVCSKCMEAHKFLYAYLNKFSYVSVTDDTGKTAVENVRECNGAFKTSVCLEDKNIVQTEVNDGQKQIKKEISEQTSDNGSKETADTNPVTENCTHEAEVKSDGSMYDDKTAVENVRECNGTFKTSVSLEDKNIVKAKVNEDQKHIKKENSEQTTDNESKEKAESTAVTENCIDDAEVKSESEITVKKENPDCFLKRYCIKSDGITCGPAFWPENWRKELCQCLSCMDMYHRYQCDYLLNLDDTILAYEERGKSTNESQYDKGLNALSKLDRVKQMEAIRAYTSMKGQLKEYLKEFANNKRTVCESDIKEFFERIGKRQKLSNGVPHFCR